MIGISKNIEKVIAKGKEADKGPVCVDDAHRDWNDKKSGGKGRTSRKSTGVREYAHRVRTLRQKGTP